MKLYLWHKVICPFLTENPEYLTGNPLTT